MSETTMTNEAKSGEPLRVAVFADFVCPYSYLAVEQIDRIAREYDVKPLWRPHWLHPDTPLEGAPRESGPEAEAKKERRNAWFKEMAPQIYPRMRFPDRRHYSFFAFEALEWAYDYERDFEFKTAVYDLMWTEEADIGDVNTLALAADRVGLDGAELKREIIERNYAERALNAVDQARRIGITSTPTIFIGRTRINGWHYDEVLQSVLEKQGAKPKVALAS